MTSPAIAVTSDTRLEDCAGTLAEKRLRRIPVVDDDGACYGIVSQGARYEGLITGFVEYLGAFGGRIIDDRGEVVVNRPEASLEHQEPDAREQVALEDNSLHEIPFEPEIEHLM